MISLKSGDKITHWVLATMLFGLSVRVAKSVLNHYFLLEDWHRNLGLAGFLVVTPSFWLYGRLILNSQFNLKLKHLLHYSPTVIYVVFSWLIPNHSSVLSYASYTFVLSHYFIYLILGFKLRQAHVNNFTNKYNIDWYGKIMMGLALIGGYYGLVFLSIIDSYIGGAVFHSVLIYVFFFVFMNRHKLISEKYINSDLTELEIKTVFSKFEKLILKTKHYLSPGYSLKEAAISVNISPRKLSQAINVVTQKNFSEYINILRVKHAQFLLIDQQSIHSKIAIIGLECGFGNTTSFNQAFKAYTGVTPSRYREISYKES